MAITSSWRLLAVAVLAGASPATVRAQTSTVPVTELDTITSTATRSAEPIHEIPATTSVIDTQQLERQNAQNPRDAIRYEPGVSVGSFATRAGSTNYVIRGIGENRVRLQIDGVKVPDYPQTNVGPGLYTRDFVDLDTVKQIDIVRGPASALYGSDALGGVVAYVTKDPADYLRLVGKDWYTGGKIAYSGADRSTAETATAAWRAGRVEALALYTRRDGNEVTPNGSVGANPQDWYANSLLGKVVLQATDIDIFNLTAERNAKDVETDLQSEVGGAVLASKSNDITTRNRLSLDYTRDAPVGFVEQTRLLAYYTSVDRVEHRDQDRTGSVLRVVDYGFEQDILGGEIQLQSQARLFGLPNTFTYGISLDYTTTSRPRDGTQYNLGAGTSTKTIAGETFPNKNFPDTTTVQAGAYVQDKLVAGPLAVIPALRFDYYHLDPHPDADFRRSSAGTTMEIAPVTETAVSPKLGLTYALDERYTAFGQYAHGFRAPPYDNANFGFSNPVFGYEILPNGNLKPETSDGIELGLRGRFGNGSSFSFAGFYNQYADFIDTVVVGTSGGGLIQYQYQNASQVTIWGAEFKGEWRLLPAWSLLGSAAYARGENDETGAPIDSVDPFRIVGGVRYSHPSDGWGAELIATRAWQHDRVGAATYFEAPAYTVLDLIAHYDVMPTFSINAGVFNLTNEKYFLSQDVIGLAASSSTRDRYAQPGRTVGVNLTLRW